MTLYRLTKEVFMELVAGEKGYKEVERMFRNSYGGYRRFREEVSSRN